MKSPFTNGETQLQKEKRQLTYRKETFTVSYHYYVCIDTAEQFTTDELDTLNVNQVHNKYREKFGIPFIDEIIRIRNQYGLTAIKMSEVLGLGANSYRNYENGEIPSVANGRLIKLAERPREFLELLEMSKNTFESGEYEKVLKKVQHAVSEESINDYNWTTFIFENLKPNILNGYQVPNLDKIDNMVCFFARNNEPYTTALNKLMFYSDFGHFKQYGNSISGISYKALKLGPVPENYDLIYNHAVRSEVVKVIETIFGECVGQKYIGNKEEDPEAFTMSEYEILKKVSEKFKKSTTNGIIDLSHEEPAWIDNINGKNRISYEYSFELKHL